MGYCECLGVLSVKGSQRLLYGFYMCLQGFVIRALHSGFIGTLKEPGKPKS